MRIWIGDVLWYLDHPGIFMADTGLGRRKYMALCVENCDCVPPLNQCKFQFAAPICSVEEQLSFPTVNVLELHLQTKEHRNVYNLGQGSINGVVARRHPCSFAHKNPNQRRSRLGG